VQELKLKAKPMEVWKLEAVAAAWELPGSFAAATKDGGCLVTFRICLRYPAASALQMGKGWGFRVSKCWADLVLKDSTF
jgi:hypothetical protein